MKKIMLCSLVAGMGMLANAAALEWQYTSTQAEYTAGYQVFVMLGTTAKTDWESLDAVKNSSDKLASGSIGEYGGRTKTYDAHGSISNDNLTKSSSYYYLIVNGDQYKASNVYTGTNIYDPAAQESSTATTTLDTSALAGTSWTSFGGGSSGGGGGQQGGGGVPEPTSGLLLLVGGAMLALRRKQK